MLRSRLLITLLVAAAAVSLAAAPASARMKTTKLGTGLCLTEGGGRFVGIPGFPGERIDRRLLRDVRWMVRHYKIYVTDGFSRSDVHSANGEHPLGLALDIVPDTAAGGTWAEITDLARFAEPRRNSPIAPFRWVGYDGDSNHGRGHHLHLSWSHSPGRFGKPVRSVYTMRCPRPKQKRGQGGKRDGDREHDGGGKDGGSRDGGGTGDRKPKPTGPSGGTESGQPPGPSGGTESGDAPAPEDGGGVRPRLAPAVPETSGVS